MSGEVRSHPAPQCHKFQDALGNCRDFALELGSDLGQWVMVEGAADLLHHVGDFGVACCGVHGPVLRRSIAIWQNLL